MSLHGLTSITLGVPDVEAVAGYYEDFGLVPTRAEADGGRRGFATADGGDQLVVVPAARRRLLEIAIGADDQDDIGRIAGNLTALGVEFSREAERLQVQDPNSALNITVAVAPRFAQAAAK